MKHKPLFYFIFVILVLFLNACSSNNSGQDSTEIGIVYKSPT